TASQSTPTTTAGSAVSLKSDAQVTDGNAATRATPYLRFTVPALAAGESISAANLSLQVTNATTNGPAIWRTATTWTEGTMTWNTGQPARSGTAAVGNFGSMAVGRVSTPVSGITAAGAVSFQLYADAIDGLDFASRENTTAGNRPQLNLTIRTGGTTTPDTTAPPAPTVNPATGTYTTAQSVTMADAEAGAVIRYTVGTGTTVPADPTAASPQYTAAVNVGSSQVIKAAAFDAAGNRSAITQRNYTISTAPTGGTRTVVLNPVADVTASQLTPTTVAGSAASLKVDQEATDGNAATRATSYLRFTVPALAAGESISAANLSLQVTNATTNGPAIWRTATTWNEATMTWNTGQPARSGTAAVGNFGAMAAGRIGTPVSGITAAGDVSFQLYAEAIDGLDFASRENTTATNRPQLTVTIRTP
ncbi:MAG TPA: DNRLRE domain-containing protein, partial [Actinomycetales bacterium]|nr:DNRLRE domain-containing protein [Actinomycetales bacterium]